MHTGDIVIQINRAAAFHPKTHAEAVTYAQVLEKTEVLKAGPNSGPEDEVLNDVTTLLNELGAD